MKRTPRIRTLLSACVLFSLGTTGCFNVLNPCDRPVNSSRVEGGWKVVEVTDLLGVHQLPYKPTGLAGAPELIEGSLIFTANQYEIGDKCENLDNTEGFVVADYHYNKGAVGLFDEVKNWYAGSFYFSDLTGELTVKSGTFSRKTRVDKVNNQYVMKFSGSAEELKKEWKALGTITVKLVRQ